MSEAYAPFSPVYDGKVSWTAHADLADAAAAILADEGRYGGPTPPLTGWPALDFAELAQIASELQGRAVRRQITSDAQLQTTLSGRGVLAGGIEIALGFYRAGRNGEFSEVSSTLEQLLGRRPIAMRDVMAQEIARLRAT